MMEEKCFTYFQESIDSYSLPARFTYPFYYEPHPLCLLAVKELQQHLQTQTEWTHEFGIEGHVEGINIGKMFGVLLVQNQRGEIGYLSAFSGKLAGSNHHAKFVPPVVDILLEESFFRKEEKVIMAINQQIDTIQKSETYLACRKRWEDENKLAVQEIESLREKVREAKAHRKMRRQQGEQELSPADFEALLGQLGRESVQGHFELKDLNRNWKLRLSARQEELEVFESQIKQLKEKRRSKSGALQQKIFDQYQFLNREGKSKSLHSIFENTTLKVPPSGAGECAAPKMLQYAFKHGMKPLALAEFWWGQSPNSEIRKHGYFYPCCKGKCEPILSHMLAGMEMDESPILSVSTTEKTIETIYEDEEMLVINKPADFLSVPGRSTADSVYARMMNRYPHATGPVMVHRLDRATSGLMLIAKTKDTHKALQDQFLTNGIKKRYVALLKGLVTGDEGTIDLPLRVDLDDRPRQLVCYEYGKPALTKWKVISRENNQTRIHFYPITGRTHQLRMHAAHADGLNHPIVGDELYGKKSDRLYLHAEAVEFIHPVLQQRMSFEVPAEF
ncbi:pseudouridine synthase [Reichenbachiella agarivorans]|uniref:Pseudouridine synthase n=1 Tax=Reichenbachiella agarivorans TaxID=2979464 RepID=A0ABY6CLG1_9BACT|nr:pseudouridine synthase [Reichenbachiella agarivorans]UXP31317.1 pseudouridine synthase [Reichenbachiella agarivorans]